MMYIEMYEHKSGSYAVKTEYLDIPDFIESVSELFNDFGLVFHKEHKKFPGIRNIWVTTKWEFLPKLLEELHALYREEIPVELNKKLDKLKQTHRQRIKLDESLIRSEAKGQFQLDGIQEGIQTNRLILAWEMGLGKSFVVISILNHKVKYNNVDRVLVLCPLESMINFKREMLRFNSFGLTEDSFYLVTPENREPFTSGKKIVICTYRRFLMIGEDAYKKKNKTKIAPKRIMKPVLDLDKWGKNRFIVLDESHLVKNRKAKQTKMVRAHIESFEYRYELTGTPAPKGVEDYYSQIEILDRTAIGVPYNLFLRKIAELEENTNAILKYTPEGVKEFEFNTLPWISRKTSKGNIDLPPLIEKPIFCMLFGKQKEIYQEIVQESFVRAKEQDGQILTKTVKNKTPYIMQSLEDPSLLKGKISKELSTSLFNKVNSWKFEDNVKIPVLNSILERHKGEKIILWGGHPNTLDNLAKLYGKTHGMVALHGQSDTQGLSKEDFRERELDKFRNDKDIKMIGLSYYAFSSAINLIESTVSVYFDLPTDFKFYGQSKKRNHRIGQEKKVILYNLIIENSLDQWNYYSLCNEKGIRNEVLFNTALTLTKEQWKRIFTGSYFLNDLTNKSKEKEVKRIKSIKRLMISHCDLDGHGALLLGKILSNKKPKLAYAEQISANYGFEEDEDLWKKILTYDIIHMVDISIPIEKYRELSTNSKVFLFDHHDSSEELSSFSDTFHDMGRCGTKIYFQEYFLKQFSRIPKAYYDFVERVNVYDIWNETSPLWEEGCNLNRVLMGMTDWNEQNPLLAASAFYAKYLIKLERITDWIWLEGEKILIERSKNKEERSYQEAIKNLSIRKDDKGDVFGVSSIGSKISLVCSRILKEYSMLRYIIIVNSFKLSEGRMSIRSRDPEFDCTGVYPFEGHFSAAGCMLQESEVKELLENESLCLIRKEEFIQGKEIFNISKKV